jgi:hypothetical protein
VDGGDAEVAHLGAPAWFSTAVTSYWSPLGLVTTDSQGKLLMGVVGTNPVYERYMLTSDR